VDTSAGIKMEDIEKYPFTNQILDEANEREFISKSTALDLKKLVNEPKTQRKPFKQKTSAMALDKSM